MPYHLSNDHCRCLDSKCPNHRKCERYRQRNLSFPGGWISHSLTLREPGKPCEFIISTPKEKK